MFTLEATLKNPCENSIIKFSVVVPVYNVDRFLRKCLDSIASQTLKEFEVICVNDSSTDNSLEILQEFAAKDSRFKVISQDNQGQGVARNNALDIAQGKYALFVDSDDFIEPDTLKTLYNKFIQTNADIIQFDYTICRENGKKSKKKIYKKKIKKEFNYSIKNNAIFNWNNIKKKSLEGMSLLALDKAYKIELIKRNGIKFAPNKNAEDHIFSISASLLADRILYVNEAFYNYRTRSNSCVNKVSDDNFCIFENIELLREFLVSKNLFDEYKTCFKKYTTTVLSWHYANIAQESSEKYLDKCKILLDSEDYKTFIKKNEGNLSVLEKIFSLKNQKKNGEKIKLITIFGLTFKLAPSNKTKFEIVNFKLLSFLISWIFPTKNDRQIFRNLCNSIENRKTTTKVQLRYKKIIKKIASKGRYNVIFLINEISKWKCQSLYDALDKSENYNPMIVLTFADIQKGLSIEEKKDILEKNQNFFKNKGMDAILSYDLNSDKAISLKDLNPDIVFYQQPYNLAKIQSPNNVSKYALTCYIPYYLPDYRNFELDCEYDFYHKLFRFYVLNNELKEEYENHLKEINEFDGNLKAIGHTMIDLFSKEQSAQNKEYVIYAPHWSINHPENKNNINISTFDKNGLQILDFAKKHPEINWVFKPHPTLKTALKRIGWPQNSIDNYFKEWEKIALVSYDCDYVKLFLSSKAMITDSGSFLLEYFITGKPLIHLISDSATNMPYKQFNKYFNSFYKAYNQEELDKYLDEIVLNNKDYKLEERKKLLENSKLTNNNAANNIIKDLDSVFKGAAL